MIKKKKLNSKPQVSKLNKFNNKPQVSEDNKETNEFDPQVKETNESDPEIKLPESPSDLVNYLNKLKQNKLDSKHQAFKQTKFNKKNLMMSLNILK